MMMTKHTPGPWIIKTASNGDKGIVAPGIGILAECFVAIRNMNEISPEVDANARLIAAAPDMLEALHKIENWLSASFIATPQDMAQSFEEMYWTARHAIAKAKGQAE